MSCDCLIFRVLCSHSVAFESTYFLRYRSGTMLENPKATL